jgi:hypothetical protein
MKHVKKIKIDLGVPPYSYTWSTNTSCFTFDKPTGTTENGEVDVVVNVSNENCYVTSNIIKITAVDSLGCKHDEDFTLENPCTTFLNPTLNDNGFNNGIYTYVALGKGGRGPYTYSWSYPTNIFKVIGSSTDNVLKLALLNNAPFQFDFPYPIKVTVKDASECSKTTTTFKVFCRATTTDFSVLGECSGCGFGSIRLAIDFNKYITACKTSAINWDTLNILTDFDSLDGTYSVKNINGVVTICVDVAAVINSGYDLLGNNNTIKFYYNVKDTDGVLSTTGEVVAALPDCLFERSAKCLTTFPFTVKTDCSWTLPKDITVPLTDINNPLVMQGSAQIDWTTFTFIASNSQSLDGNKKLILTNSNEYAILNDNNEIVIHLVDLDTSNNAELIRWKVCDKNNCCSSQTSTVVEMACLEPPKAENDTLCIACGDQVVVDILDNDDAPNVSNNSIITITSPPTKGVVTVAGLIINYLTYPTIDGADSFKYTITDDNGLTSNEGTVSITITCAGVPGSEITCN